MVIALSVSITGAGCGSKNNNTVESQKEVAVNDTDNKKTEKQESVVKVSEKVNEVPGIKEETITEDEKADTQQTALTDDNTSDNSPSNSSSSNNSSGNSNTGNSANSGNQNNSGNTASSSGNGNTGSSGGENNNSGNSSNSGNGANNSNAGNSFNNNTNTAPAPTPAPAPQHEHTWVHHDATGHYETVTIQAAWDEEIPVYADVAHDICTGCGADITKWSESEIANHAYNHMINDEEAGHYTEWKYEQTGTQKVHHDAVTEQRWIEDIAAYDQCSSCGAIK